MKETEPLPCVMQPHGQKEWVYGVKKQVTYFQPNGNVCCIEYHLIDGKVITNGKRPTAEDKCNANR
jgi:hypothetical protein